MRHSILTFLLVAALAGSASSQPLEFVQDIILGFVPVQTAYNVTVSQVKPSPDNMRFLVTDREWEKGNVRREYLRALDLETLSERGQVSSVTFDENYLSWRGFDVLETSPRGRVYHLGVQNGRLMAHRENNEPARIGAVSQITSEGEKLRVRLPTERIVLPFKDFSGLGLYDAAGNEVRFLESSQTILGLSVKKGESLVKILPGSRPKERRKFIDVKTGEEFVYGGSQWDLDGVISDIDHDPILNRLFIHHGRSFSAYYLDNGKMISFPMSVGRDDGDDFEEIRDVIPVLGYPLYVMTSRLMQKNPNLQARHDEPYILLGLTMDVVDENSGIVQSIQPFFGIETKSGFEKHILEPMRKRYECDVRVCISEKFVTLITFGIDEKGRLVKGLKVFRPNASVQ